MDSSVRNASSIEEVTQLEEYLIKFIELVPNLKEINKEEKINRILFSPDANEESDQTITHLDQNKKDGQSEQQQQNQCHESSNYTQHLENLQNLEISTKTISDLQILQSVLDYIVDLKAKVNV